MKPYIVIPTYNEAANIGELIDAIFALHIPDLNIIVVDDNSPDKTADIVKHKMQDFPISIIQREKKLGLGSAYIAGFSKALEQGATHIFEMDADFSHNPKDIPRLLAATQSYDISIGSRKIEGGSIIGWNVWRRFMSNGALWISKLMLRIPVKDITAGFRCYTRQVLESLDLSSIKSNGYAFQEEMLYLSHKKGFTIAEIPVTFIDRAKGQSKLSFKDIIEFFIVLVRLTRKK